MYVQYMHIRTVLSSWIHTFFSSKKCAFSFKSCFPPETPKGLASLVVFASLHSKTTLRADSTICNFRASKIRLSTFLFYPKFSARRISKLWNCQIFRRVVTMFAWFCYFYSQAVLLGDRRTIIQCRKKLLWAENKYVSSIQPELKLKNRHAEKIAKNTMLNFVLL